MMNARVLAKNIKIEKVAQKRAYRRQYDREAKRAAKVDEEPGFIPKPYGYNTLGSPARLPEHLLVSSSSDESDYDD